MQHVIVVCMPTGRQPQPIGRNAFIGRLTVDGNNAVRGTFRHAFAYASTTMRILGKDLRHTMRRGAARHRMPTAQITRHCH